MVEAGKQQGTEVHSPLWVCWSTPSRMPDENTSVLSFLSPSAEEKIEGNIPGRLIRAREVSLKVRACARKLYIHLVAQIGTVRDAEGRTLRSRLAVAGQASRWWYHLTAFKDCEADPVFQWIIAVLTIEEVARGLGAKHLVLVSAPFEVAEMLRTGFVVEEQSPGRSRGAWRVWLAGLVSRLKYGIKAFLEFRTLRKFRGSAPDRRFDVVLSGFWDWSVGWDDSTQSLADRYFKALPAALRAQGTASVGWVTWFDPWTAQDRKKRRLDDTLAPAANRPDLVILQTFLRARDVLAALASLGATWTYLSMRRLPDFRQVFHEGGLDYYPLFADTLLSGFLGSGIPHCELVATATERACRSLRPRIAVSFLEHFPYARAHYEGVRRAGTGTVNYAMQHASYNHEKTFLFLDPELEFHGGDDGCEVPKPDYVCAMGTLGRDLFLECGYSPDRVLLTGSARYDHVSAPAVASPRSGVSKQAGMRVLIVAAHHADLDFEMLDAVCSASRDLDGVHLVLKAHPFRRLAEQPEFAPYKPVVRMTEGTLEEELAQADLILFTYSTVAEEAFIRGNAVWQWCSFDFNGSALGEALPIPRFFSVSSLRQALLEFRADPGKFLPTSAERHIALERLFYKGDGRAADRIASVLTQAAGRDEAMALPACGR